jgi:hypothetical protein
VPSIQSFIIEAPPKGFGFPTAALADLIEKPAQRSLLRGDGIEVQVLTRPRGDSLDLAVMHFDENDKDGSVDFACRVPPGPGLGLPPKEVLRTVVDRFGVPLLDEGTPRLFWDEIVETGMAPNEFDLRILHAPCATSIVIAICAPRSASSVMVPLGFAFDVSKYLAWREGHLTTLI